MNSVERPALGASRLETARNVFGFIYEVTVRTFRTRQLGFVWKHLVVAIGMLAVGSLAARYSCK